MELHPISSLSGHRAKDDRKREETRIRCAEDRPAGQREAGRRAVGLHHPCPQPDGRRHRRLPRRSQEGELGLRVPRLHERQLLAVVLKGSPAGKIDR